MYIFFHADFHGDFHDTNLVSWTVSPRTTDFTCPKSLSRTNFVTHIFVLFFHDGFLSRHLGPDFFHDISRPVFEFCHDISRPTFCQDISPPPLGRGGGREGGGEEGRDGGNEGGREGGGEGREGREGGRGWGGEGKEGRGGRGGILSFSMVNIRFFLRYSCDACHAKQLGPSRHKYDGLVRFLV